MQNLAEKPVAPVWQKTPLILFKRTRDELIRKHTRMRMPPMRRVSPLTQPTPAPQQATPPGKFLWYLQGVAFGAAGGLLGMAMTLLILQTGFGNSAFPKAHLAVAQLAQEITPPQLSASKCFSKDCGTNLAPVLDEVAHYLPPVNASALQPPESP